MDHLKSSIKRKKNAQNLKNILKDFGCSIIIGGNDTFKNFKDMMALCVSDNKGLLLIENDVVSFNIDIVKKSINDYPNSVINFSFPVLGHIKGYLYLYNQCVYFPLEICKELINKMDKWCSKYPYYHKRNEHDIYVSSIIKDFYSVDADIQLASFDSELNHNMDSKEVRREKILSKNKREVFAE